MTNIKIKGEEIFKKLFEKTFGNLQEFREKFDEFKEGIENKREWVDERSDKWHNNPENEAFNNHLLDVEEFVENLEELLIEIEELEYPINEE